MLNCVYINQVDRVRADRIRTGFRAVALYVKTSEKLNNKTLATLIIFIIIKQLKTVL